MTTKAKSHNGGAGPSLPGPSINNIGSTELASYLENVIDSIKDAESVAYVLHDDPDPDALGSGFAGYKLAEKYGTDAAIFHGEEMSHVPNQNFADELEIPNTPYSEAEEPLEEFDQVYLIDTNGGHLNVMEESEENLHSNVTGITDHHEDNSENFDYPNLSERDKWIEQDAGSTATLWAEVLESDGYFESDNVEDREKIRVATALMRGIETDTYEREDETERDQDSYSILEERYNELTGEQPDIHEKLLSEERQRKQDLEYDLELEINLDSPETPVEYLKIVEPASDRKDDIWRASDYEIKNAPANTAVISYGEAENGTGTGVKTSGRAKFEDQINSDQFDFEEFLTESHVLEKAKGNQNMGGKQIRKIHEAGGWMPEIDKEDFKAGLVDLASSYTFNPHSMNRDRRGQSLRGIPVREIPFIHNARRRPRSRLRANIIYRRSPFRTVPISRPEVDTKRIHTPRSRFRADFRR